MALGGAGVSLLAIVALSQIGLRGAVAAATLLPLILVFLISSIVASGGFVCLWRDARISSGKVDIFAVWANRPPTKGWLSSLGLRFVLGPSLRPGDDVQVKSLAEIQATLDASGSVEGLPFMAEMRPYCGKTFLVHRRIDKINDMRLKTGLRRMHDAVTLTDLRCSGAEHNGCQAECQILWKDEWLTRLPAGSGPQGGQRSADLIAHMPDAPGFNPGVETHVCQMTRLWEASRPMSRVDIRQDLRPLLSGNIGLGAYSLALLTRLFNTVQKWRGGTDFPAMTPAALAPPPEASPGALFGPRQKVCVRGREDIALTLVKSRTKGLWFDRDMVRFCGQPAVMRKHVNRVIHEASGKMVMMKTPSVVLEDVVATGEFLRLCPQHEYIFWRKVWLRPVGAEIQETADSHSSR